MAGAPPPPPPGPPGAGAPPPSSSSSSPGAPPLRIHCSMRPASCSSAAACALNTSAMLAT
eukprot:11529871-Prorocentrum_lima.AAC.1